MIKKYVPVLRSRSAEYLALSDLAEETKDSILPLAELFLRDSSEAKELEQTLFKEEISSPGLALVKDRAKRLFECWGQREVFIDGLHLPNWVPRPHIKTVIDGFYAEAARHGMNCVPVTTFKEGLSSEFHAAISKAVNEFGNGLAFRINHKNGLGYEDYKQVDNFINKFGLRTDQVDLIIDLQHIGSVSVYPEALKYYLLRAESFRRIVILSGAFLKDLTKFKNEDVIILPRKDLLLWENICNEPWTKKSPLLGDYATQYGEFKPAKHRLSPSAQIRYATKKHWTVTRGRRLDKKKEFCGPEQYRGQALKISKIPEFLEGGVSKGDRAIMDAASGIGYLGDHQFWLRMGINRHLTLTANQLSVS